MGRRKKGPVIIENLTVLDAVAEGKSLAKNEDQVIFLTNAVPGDVVDVRITKRRRRYLEGKAIAFHQLSDKRTEPFCSHFGVCGGCKWQFMKYDEQLHYKQQQVKDNLERIGGLENPQIAPIMAAPETQYYRNKLEFTFSNSEWLTEEQVQSGEQFESRDALGFHVPGRFDKVLDVKHCHLQAEPSNAIRLWVKEYALKHELTFFDLRKQEGLLRNLIIRTAESGEVMVILCFYYEDKAIREQMLAEMHKTFPNIDALLYVINPKANDTISDLDIQTFAGKDHIEEKMPYYEGEGFLKFKIGPKSFYQTNSKQAYELYRIAADFADLSGDELVYDLYTGTGTIANFVASKAQKVVGVEYVPEAIVDAKINARNNAVDNAVFFAGDMKDILTEDFIAEHGKADVVITDPPRAGMHEDVVKQLLAMAAPKVVYVSCNPATQARDIKLMEEQYKVSKIQPVDMFPQTHHVENVILLEHR